MQEQFSRTAMLFGEDALETLFRCHVAVFGVGGVGSYAVEALARCGIGKLDLIDADDVDITNLNRQIIALHSTVGKCKVDVAAERVRDINPQCCVKAYRQFYLPENADMIDLSQYDYVIDCIDTVTAKIELIRRCHQLGVQLISCMGAANKLNPMGFRVTDISKTQTDPIAKVIRRKLRDLGIPRLLCVWSDEQPVAVKSAPTVCEDTQNRKPRRSIPASNSFVPAAAGLLAAATVVKALAGID